MMRCSLRTVLTVAALSFAGQAQANFMIVTTGTTVSTMATSGTALALTFTQNSLGTTGAGGPTPTPTGGNSFNFLDINYPGSMTTGSGTITFSGSFQITNNGVSGTGSFTEVLNYNVSGGYGNLTVASTTISASPGLGVTFAPISFTAPTLSDGTGSMGNLSTTVTTVAPTLVPEPASALMLVCGLSGLGFVARRRMVA